MASTLVFVEHRRQELRKTSLAGITFGQQVATRTGGSVHLLLIGHDLREVAAQAARYKVAGVIVVDQAQFANYTTEAFTAAVVAARAQCQADLVCGATSTTTKDLLPRVAARLDAAMASDVVAVVAGDTFKRPMWAGNVVATVKLHTPLRVCTARPTEFGAPQEGPSAPVRPLAIAVDLDRQAAQFVSMQWVESARPELAAASRVVSVGRGAKGPEGLALVEQLADQLGASLGASRAACDAGWVANDLQVGQTGKVVAPDLYIAVGLSGAIQHVAGMKGSKVVVAINKDPEAPIFQVADYGVVADLFQAVPELIARLRA